jgi:hypothetical protein
MARTGILRYERAKVFVRVGRGSMEGTGMYAGEHVSIDGDIVSESRTR